MAQTLHHPIDVPEWVAGQMIDNPMQYVSPLHLIRREGIMPRVFAPHDRPLLTNKENSPRMQPTCQIFPSWESKFVIGILRSKRLLWGARGFP